MIKSNEHYSLTIDNWYFDIHWWFLPGNSVELTFQIYEFGLGITFNFDNEYNVEIKILVGLFILRFFLFANFLQRYEDNNDE